MFGAETGAATSDEEESSRKEDKDCVDLQAPQQKRWTLSSGVDLFEGKRDSSGGPYISKNRMSLDQYKSLGAVQEQLSKSYTSIRPLTAAANHQYYDTIPTTAMPTTVTLDAARKRPKTSTLKDTVHRGSCYGEYISDTLSHKIPQRSSGQSKSMTNL